MAFLFSFLVLFQFILQAEENSRRTLKNVSLTCGASSCPPGLGMVVFPEWRVAEKILAVTVCAANLIEPNRILTADHCLGPNLKDARFVPMGGSESSMYGLRRALFQESGPSTPIRFGPDLAVYELSENVPDATPLGLAALNDEEPKQLMAFLLNRVGHKGLNFQFDTKLCEVPQDFPFPLRIHPQAYKLLNCQAENGNSGSALFNPGDLQHIEAIMIEKFKNSDSAVANVRCLHLTATGAELSGCQPADVDLLGKMANELWPSRADRAFHGWIQSKGLSTTFEWEPLRIALSSDTYIEIPWPTCQLSASTYGSQWEMKLPYRIVKLIVDFRLGPEPVSLKAFTWKLSGQRFKGSEYVRAVIPNPKPWRAPEEFIQFRGKDLFPLKTCSGSSAAH